MKTFKRLTSLSSAKDAILGTISSEIVPALYSPPPLGYRWCSDLRGGWRKKFKHLLSTLYVRVLDLGCQKNGMSPSWFRRR